MRFLRKHLLVPGLILAFVGIAFWSLMQSNPISLQQVRSAITTRDERILPSQVSLPNVETFQAQMRRDLPVGTPKEAVEAYLNQLKFRYEFFKVDSTYDP